MPDKLDIKTQKTQNPDKSDDKSTPTNVPAPGEGGTPSEPPKEVLTKADLAEALNSARTQERTKLHDDIQALKTSEAAKQTEIEARDAEIAALKTAAEEAADSKLSESDKVMKRLEALEASNSQSLEREAALTLELAANKEASIELVRMSELGRYKAEQIASQEVELSELVAGDTREEIDKSIKKALERETALLQKYQARQQTEAQQQAQGDVARPLAPAAPKQPAIGGLSHADRRDVARLNKEDYAKRKAQLLIEAKQRAGLA